MPPKFLFKGSFRLLLQKPVEEQLNKYFSKLSRHKEGRKLAEIDRDSRKVRNEDKFAKVARIRGRPSEAEAASNRLLHTGFDNENRNKIDEFNYQQIRRDVNYPAKNGLYEHGSSPFEDENEVETIAYPEQISITLNKVTPRKPLPFFFTDTARDHTEMDFEGSDEDPESRDERVGNNNGDDSFDTDNYEDQREWEKLQRQLHNPRQKGSTAQYEGEAEALKKRGKKISGPQRPSAPAPATLPSNLNMSNLNNSMRNDRAGSLTKKTSSYTEEPAWSNRPSQDVKSYNNVVQRGEEQYERPRLKPKPNNRIADSHVESDVTFSPTANHNKVLPNRSQKSTGATFQDHQIGYRDNNENRDNLYRQNYNRRPVIDYKNEGKPLKNKPNFMKDEPEGEGEEANQEDDYYRDQYKPGR